MSSVIELFVTSPRAFLAMLSSKLFNDAVSMGLHDTLAASIDVAVRAMNGAGPTAGLFTSPNVPLSNVIKVLSSPNIGGPAIARIFGTGIIPISTIKTILGDTSIPADKVQATLYSMADLGYFDLLVNLFTFDRSDATYSTSTTLTTGVNYLRNVSIASGVTLTLGASPCVIVADTLTNSGTITTNVVKGAGGAPGASGAGAGGAGRHGIIILARTLGAGTVVSDGASGAAGSAVAANGSGGAGGAGLFWEVFGYPAGIGGGGGNYNAGGGSKNAGGGGGGYTVAYYGGSGGAASVATYLDPTRLLADILKTVADHWTVNILGKTPTGTMAVPALGGSGGGGGAAQDTYSAGGGGGGGGGQIVVYGTLLASGSFFARGGAGGNGGGEGSYDAGGGGGGGGIVYVFRRTRTGTLSFNVAGGAAGAGDPPYPASAGSAGSAAEFVV